jgi:DNA-binding MarR family transcriptional regulator
MGLTLGEFLPYRLNSLSEAVSQQIKPIYRDRFGLNRPEWRVLVALADLGTATAKEIGAHSAQHKTRISRAVRALEQRRWLTREADPADRRSENLTLTPAGHRAYCDLVGPMRAQETRILERLSPQDRAALGSALSALEQALGLNAR